MPQKDLSLEKGFDEKLLNLINKWCYSNLFHYTQSNMVFENTLVIILFCHRTYYIVKNLNNKNIPITPNRMFVW